MKKIIIKNLFILSLFILGLSFSILGVGFYLEEDNENKKDAVDMSEYVAMATNYSDGSSTEFTIYKNNDTTLDTFNVLEGTTLSTNPTNKQTAYLLSDISTSEINFNDLVDDASLKSFIETGAYIFDTNKYVYYSISKIDTINLGNYIFDIYQESFKYLDNYAPTSSEIVKFTAVSKIDGNYLSVSYNQDFLNDLNTSHLDLLNNLVK